MKLLSFNRAGADSFGAVVDGGVIDLKPLLGGDFADLKAVLQEGALDRVAGAATGAADFALGEITFLPVLPEPGKIVCVGRNYADHAQEMGMDLPPNPGLFIKLPGALAGHEQDILRPRVSECFDFEAELAFVIGRPGRYIAEADAFDHIAGYTILNDGSIRDWQRDNVIAGKNFPRTSGFGPWLVTADDMPDPSRLSVVSRLNGTTMQDGNTSDLIYAIPRIVNYISSFTELAPGDVISTGSPAGVGAGREPPLWMKPGDVIEVEIEGIGVLRNRVIDDPDMP